MVKKQENKSKRSMPELSETQKERIDELKAEMTKIKQEGRFISFYQKIRKESVAIMKEDATETEKKTKLLELCNKVAEEINETL